VWIGLWPLNCTLICMTKEILSLSCRPRSLLRGNRLCSLIAGLVMLSTVPNAQTAGLPTEPPEFSQGVAFARHLASLENGDAFERSGPVAVSIEASLPGLYKEASFLAVRDHDENGRPKYYVLALGGDGTVLAEVTGRYFAAEQQMHEFPASSIAITPANYKFRFAGSVTAGETPAYIYRITAKRGRRGLLSGQVWMDSRTGAEVMVTGRLAKLPSTNGPADVVCETRLLNGSRSNRVTHMAFTVPNLGRAELVVTEYLLQVGRGGNEAGLSLTASMR
jgi:hypothetical protein